MILTVLNSVACMADRTKSEVSNFKKVNSKNHLSRLVRGFIVHVKHILNQNAEDAKM